ncbi:hypothetical protein AUC71_07730 [Methyloceanibacter marginalis]|uniref:Uncharacterized protein n=1 Tax=Methyloceanibacter marginalis TaxID=1774971 RepID=A0A1E3WDC4_9HYPH|nr:hypothetical protein AUC71_07730 [Methyloceanibacter marginalis]
MDEALEQSVVEPKADAAGVWSEDPRRALIAAVGVNAPLHDGKAARVLVDLILVGTLRKQGARHDGVPGPCVVISAAVVWA